MAKIQPKGGAHRAGASIKVVSGGLSSKSIHFDDIWKDTVQEFFGFCFKKCKPMHPSIQAKSQTLHYWCCETSTLTTQPLCRPRHIQSCWTLGETWWFYCSLDQGVGFQNNWRINSNKSNASSLFLTVISTKVMYYWDVVRQEQSVVTTQEAMTRGRIERDDSTTGFIWINNKKQMCTMCMSVCLKMSMSVCVWRRVWTEDEQDEAKMERRVEEQFIVMKDR